ncbi:AMP-binding protein [Bradyrhizobium sp. USDA 10063]
MQQWYAPDPVALHARIRPDQLACVDLATDRRWTYAQLDRAIDQMVGALAALPGMGRGERIAALARNSGDLLILQQATMRAGAIFVPLNWRLSRAELAPILADCTPFMLVSDGTAAVDVPADCTVMTVVDLIAMREAAAPAVKKLRPEASDPCVILYTSGTSGQPKGVVLTAQMMFFTAINFGILGDVGSGSVFLCESPMFHVIGLVTSIWPAIARGAAILISSGFDPILTNERLANSDLSITHYFCVPQMASALRQAQNFRPKSWSLRALFTGGAPNSRANILWWLERGVCMVDGFGMTETGTALGMSLDPALIASKAGSVGLPGPGTMVRLVDEAGKDVPDGRPGEILIAGPGVTPGYWKCAAECAHVFTTDGWLWTGDIGIKDEDGFFTIVDRRKDIFITGGENVYPVEVEAVLLEHPQIAEAAVIGVPDERWGEVGRAYLVFKSGSDTRPNVVDLAAYCGERLARYKIPKEFRAAETLPRTGSGKLQKAVLKKQALEEVAAAATTGVSEESKPALA